jgi:hypothetical protein
VILAKNFGRCGVLLMWFNPLQTPGKRPQQRLPISESGSEDFIEIHHLVPISDLRGVRSFLVFCSTTARSAFSYACKRCYVRNRLTKNYTAVSIAKFLSWLEPSGEMP